MPQVRKDICCECGKQFAGKVKLSIHMNTHTKIRPHQCPMCDRSFSDPAAAKRHASVHSKQRQHECTLCGKSYRQKSALQEHVQSIHEGKVHPCSICGLNISSKRALKRHQATHSEIRPFQCSFCPKTFKQETGRRNHEIRHSNIRRHPCAYCEKSFHTLFDRSLHHLRHLGKRPIECVLCPYNCVERIELKRHIKSHHTTEGVQLRKKKEQHFHNWLLQNGFPNVTREQRIDFRCDEKDATWITLDFYIHRGDDTIFIVELGIFLTLHCATLATVTDFLAHRWAPAQWLLAKLRIATSLQDDGRANGRCRLTWRRFLPPQSGRFHDRWRQAKGQSQRAVRVIQTILWDASEAWSSADRPVFLLRRRWRREARSRVRSRVRLDAEGRAAPTHHDLKDGTNVSCGTMLPQQRNTYNISLSVPEIYLFIRFQSRDDRRLFGASQFEESQAFQSSLVLAVVRHPRFDSLWLDERLLGCLSLSSWLLGCLSLSQRLFGCFPFCRGFALNTGHIDEVMMCAYQIALEKKLVI